jgi:4,5:9,10-diseco-3-hydroxy-5,9,17-trioxoandrosta-1(10),2-diene-4-oate hydrolase
VLWFAARRAQLSHHLHGSRKEPAFARTDDDATKAPPADFRQQLPGAATLDAKTAIPTGAFATVRGGRYRLHYHEAGARRPGRPTLIFLHGSGPGASGYSNFRRNYLPLAEAGWHVLAVDYLGYGLSDKPQDFQYTNANQVDLLEDWIDGMALDQVIPVGNSLGGFFALEYTLRRPEKVPRLICMAPGGVEDPAFWIGASKGMQAMGAAVREQSFNAANFRELLKLIVYDERLLTAEIIDERLPLAQTQPLSVFTTVVYTPIWDRLSEIKIPVLGFWGYHDQFLPVRHAMVMQEKLADCRMLISNRAGHWFMIEETELFNATCLRFLAEV